MSRPPNLLWLVTTQWRAQACGYAGDVNARTPFMDALAAESVNYAQAVTPHPFGPFARAALLTGQLSPANGVADYFDPLPANARTVAHAFSARGYATGFFGKWHLAPRDRHLPLVGEAHARITVPPGRRGGFDFWEGFEGGFLLNEPLLHGTRLSGPTAFRGYQSDVVCEQARGWMAAVTRPWFCMVSVEPPHPPYDAPSAGTRPRPPHEITLAPNVPRGDDAEARARRELSGYYAHLEATDRAFGRLLKDVSPEDSIVVFTSVHGDMHGAHGLFRKGWPHEESVRVPLLVRAPNVEPKRDATPVSLADLAALSMAWADGKRIQHSITHARISMPSVVSLPHQCDRAWRGVRTPTRKLVLNPDGSPWLFFNLERDPFELENLAASLRHERERAHLQAQLEANPPKARLSG